MEDDRKLSYPLQVHFTGLMTIGVILKYGDRQLLGLFCNNTSTPSEISQTMWNLDGAWGISVIEIE